jgi:hypothetical protein
MLALSEVRHQRPTLLPGRRMKLSDLEDYDKLQNALDRIENKFDSRFNQLEARINNLEAKINRVTWLIWVPVAASAAQIITTLAHK